MTTATKIKEHPIIFSGPMVRAILDGRKTQTRRVVTPQPIGVAEGIYPDFYNGGPEWAFWLPDNRMTEPRTWRCPYGIPGDRLWVRETWALVNDGGYLTEPSTLRWRSNGECRMVSVEELMSNEPRMLPREGWRPSIHMPRWASRLVLTAKQIRVERVQDISPEDVIAEGVMFHKTPQDTFALRITGDYPPCNYYKKGDDEATFIRAHFASLWDSINANRGFGWDVNPWIWLVEFEKVQA